MSGRTQGNYSFSSVLKGAKPWHIARRTWFTVSMKKVGAYNISQNKTLFQPIKPFYGENRISGIYIARGCWGTNCIEAGNYPIGRYEY